MDLKTAFILLVSVCHVVSLECYTCKDANDIALCNTTQLCQQGQACIHNLTTTNQGQLRNLGCVDYQQCGIHGNSPNIVGRGIQERQTSGCLECCSTDLCNKALCEHLKATSCVDDASLDCAKLNTLFSICSDIDNAKNVCPNFCGLCNVVDGNWSDWTSWSQCDVTCENGTQIRSRSCNNPVPQHGGSNCAGKSVEGKPCRRDLCPVHGGWSGWEEWGSCSVSCDMGLQSRARNCSNPIPIRNGNPCFGHNFDVRQCMPGPCANGGWSDWSIWGSCSVTCGVGVHSKTRACTNPHPSPFGKYCAGAGIDIESCTTSKCGQHHCKSNPCVNGYCYELSSDYLCMCNHGFEGRNCSISSSHCKPNPCDNGTCLDMLNDFSCRCDQGFAGRYCNISINYCLSSPCLRGKCVNDLGNFTCVCPPGVTGRFCETVPATDCYDIQKMNLGNRYGIYVVETWDTNEYLEILCDLATDGGMWTVFQHRFDGSVDFHRNLANYKQGFGNLSGEFWLGLNYIYELASQHRSELRIDLTAADGSWAYEIFPDFSLSSSPYYTLHIGNGTGTAGDGTNGLSFSNNNSFSTYDYGKKGCVERGLGGWWYSDCTDVNLNGLYITPGTISDQWSGKRGMIYRAFEQNRSLKATKLMFRRV